MKAYIASVEIEMCITANTEEEAARIASEHFMEEIDSCVPTRLDFSIKPMKYIPSHYEEDSLTYSPEDVEPITIKEALKL